MQSHDNLSYFYLTALCPADRSPKVSMGSLPLRSPIAQLKKQNHQRQHQGHAV
jgi:hypothetical protein